MHKEILSKLNFFQRINVPKYIEPKIQKIALTHLNLTDMGKLRDRFEGQLYYDKLKTDLIAEFSFEKLLGYKNFDWSIREVKNYKRKQYSFDNKELTIVTITKSRLPKINLDKLKNTVFIYVNVDNRIYVSGVATKTRLQELSISNPSKIQEFSDFESLIQFNSINELTEILE